MRKSQTKPDKGLMEVEGLIQKALKDSKTDLDLSKMGLTELPKSIGELSHLQSLKISDNQITTLPESLGQLSQLINLEVRSNEIVYLPEFISQLTQLQRLQISANKLTSLPEWIGKLAKLKQLHSWMNKLTSMPKSICNLTELERLDVSYNQITSLPEFSGLIHLKTLDLSRNQLTKLPDWINHLTKLQNLYLRGNQLVTLPKGISQMNSLYDLDISDNELCILPEWLAKLKMLSMLKIGSLNLKKLPEWIGELTHLRFLDISDNGIKILPNWVGQLAKLERFMAPDNQIKTLPEAIGSLTNLEYMDLTNNNIDTLPGPMKKLTSLKALFLHGNEALGLPPEVLGPKWGDIYLRKPSGVPENPANPSEILEYYFRTRGGRRPLNEAKLILVGYGFVGKTSLVKRLVHDKFDKEEKETLGIQITQWPLILQDHEEVRLHIWDFGGQEIMHSTHQFFLTQRSLYILVLNGRQGQEDHDAEYWLNLVKSFGEDSPVIIVLNKVKEHPFDVNRRGLRQKFPAIREFVETDCEDGTGIDELQRVIERETDGLEHLRDAFPASWFSIKDRLAGMTENYLTFDRYREICAENGETDPKAHESLAFYLHSLGIALNYKDDPRLRDTHVLNPHWVTNGIYKILKSQKIASQKGELRVDDLESILDPTEYPRGRHTFLLDLMRKFELCLSFPEEDGHYLIPELLDKQQSAEADNFKPEQCLNFQYHYPILPEGLLPRFIVRTHALSTNQPRWRTGVILKFEGNRALVKADKQDKRIFIMVAGSPPGRRRLLAVIRSDFEHIHSSFKFQPEEMVPLPEYPEAMTAYKELLVMERSGVKKYPKVVGDKVLELDVLELLNGIDLEGIRKPVPTTEESEQPLRLFYSYSHKDEELRGELETHLKLLHRQGQIEPWHDRMITAGEEWRGQIDENLERANIILLLISPDFIASDYCYDVEMKRAMERHEAGEARVIPVIVRNINWHGAPFGKLQALPKDGKAVKTWEDRDTAWRDAAEGIEKAIKQIRQKLPRK